MKLQSHLQYENSLDLQFLSDAEFRIKSKNHRVFQSKKIELGDFVPCDEDGNVLEEPNINNFKSEPFCSTGNCKAYQDEVNIYQQAKEKVLFEGFEYKKAIFKDEELFWLGDFNGETIEELIKYNLTLTPNAIKQFNL
jgi:hypothetical protein